jgi:hypothetical protein
MPPRSRGGGGYNHDRQVSRNKPRESALRRIRLRRDDAGECTLYNFSANRPGSRFPNLAKALDYARREAARDSAAIEVWQGDEYICCFEGHRRARPATGAVPPPAVPRAERWAKRTAGILLNGAGACFWLFLIGELIAASLGWQ